MRGALRDDLLRGDVDVDRQVVRQHGDAVGRDLEGVHRREDALLENEAAAFFTTDHYRNYATVLVPLARVKKGFLEEVLADAWRRDAPRRLVKEHDDS